MKDEDAGGTTFKRDLTATSTTVFKLQATRDSGMLSNRKKPRNLMKLLRDKFGKERRQMTFGVVRGTVSDMIPPDPNTIKSIYISSPLSFCNSEYLANFLIE